MKILLFGEYSALHKNLKDGLRELGHEAIVAAHGDSFKKIPADISFEPLSNIKIIGYIEKICRPFLRLRDLTNFDVVQIINPFVYYPNRLPFHKEISGCLYNKLISGNKKFFLLAAGDDAYYWRYGRKSLSYGPFDDYLKYDLKQSSYHMETDEALRFNENLVERSNGVIPVMYEYELSYKNSHKRLPVIPLPLNVDDIKYTENSPKGKLVVFHGLNRYGFKGTRHVEEAFEILRRKYPSDLELYIDGNMPLSDYLGLMQKTNIVIDQLNSYSLGMNGVYALAMGKVVLGGAEKESLASLGVDKSPVINVRPSATSIVKAVEHLLERRSNIIDIGMESRIFAERVHGHIKVANQYLDIWCKN